MLPRPPRRTKDLRLQRWQDGTMDDDRIRWDDRYDGHRLAAPTSPDVLAGRSDLLGALPGSGRALDLACGVGDQSLWLAARGLSVIALDVSPVAVDLLGEAAAAAGLTDSIDARVHDTDQGLPSDVTDLDVIVCQRFRVVALYPEMVDRLRVGGVLILTVLSAVGVDGPPGPFHAPAGELTTTFARDDVDVLFDDERDGTASIVLARIS
jgi:SAM-dependent methyltransferase